LGGEKMNDYSKNKNTFTENKIKTLNHFFMKNIMIQSILLCIIFSISIVMLIILIRLGKLEDELKITIITMIATFILTTSKTIIDKLITMIQYIISLLSEEQRGFSKNIGIEIDKIDFEKNNDID
jgi:hypothetical protein